MVPQKGTDESTLVADLSVPLMHGLSDLGSLTLIQIMHEERTLYADRYGVQ